MRYPIARSRARGDRLVAGLLAMACSLAATQARATDGEAFESARAAYNRGHYAQAVELFETMVGGTMVGGTNPAITDRILIRESRKYLGAAYVLTGRPELARQQFEELLRGEGAAMDEYRIDPAAFPGEVLQVFDEVRRELVRRRDERADELRRQAADAEAARREAQLRLLAFAEEAEVVVPNDPLLAWLPFGVGQLQNGDDGLGAFFLVSEVLTAAAAAATFSAWMVLNDIRTEGGARTVNSAVLAGLQAANWVSVGAFGLLALAGIIEAHVNFAPSRTVRRQREVPADILERLDLTVGPSGVGLRLRF